MRITKNGERPAVERRPGTPASALALRFNDLAILHSQNGNAAAAPLSIWPLLHVVGLRWPQLESWPARERALHSLVGVHLAQPRARKWRLAGQRGEGATPRARRAEGPGVVGGSLPPVRWPRTAGRAATTVAGLAMTQPA